jgi:phage-related holin
MLERLASSFDDLTKWWLLKFLAAILVTLFGAWREAYGALLILMGLDLVTGMWAAGHAHQLRASVGIRKSAVKFAMYAVVMVSARQLEVGAIGVPIAEGLGIGVPLLYLCATEAVSVLENLTRATGKRVAFPALAALIDKLAPTDPAAQSSGDERLPPATAKVTGPRPPTPPL